MTENKKNDDKSSKSNPRRKPVRKNPKNIGPYIIKSKDV
jgi:hypothetical protein